MIPRSYKVRQMGQVSGARGLFHVIQKVVSAQGQPSGGEGADCQVTITLR